jgi:hypothetical protein
MTYLAVAALQAWVLFFCALPVIAKEQSEVKTNKWQELSMETSTPDDAMRLLGTPSSDKTDKPRIMLIDRWLSDKLKEKVFRKLVYKKIAGLEKVELFFSNNKLAMIELDAKDAEDKDWFDPDVLQTMFGAEFTPVGWHFGKKLPPLQEFDTQIRTLKEFPQIYHLIAISEQRLISARINNLTSNGIGLFTRGSSAKAREDNKEKARRDAGGTLPGAVFFIQIISRNIEKL